MDDLDERITSLEITAVEQSNVNTTLIELMAVLVEKLYDKDPRTAHEMVEEFIDFFLNKSEGDLKDTPSAVWHGLLRNRL